MITPGGGVTTAQATGPPANLILEQAKSLSYEKVRDDFPAAFATPGDSGWSSYAGPNDADFAGFEYRVDKRYLGRPDPASAVQSFSNNSSDDGLVKLTVTVR